MRRFPIFIKSASQKSLIHSMRKSHFYLIALVLLATVAVGCTNQEELSDLSSGSQAPTSYKFLSAEEAGNLAGLFMASLSADSTQTRSKDLTIEGVKLLSNQALTRASENDTTFYVVNFKEGGYAIVAADRGLENNIYVYSPTEKYNGETSSFMGMFLENALMTMKDAPRNSGTQSSSSPLKKPEIPNPFEPARDETIINGQKCIGYVRSSHSVKNPLLSTEWCQEYPYNYYCPLDNGKSTLVGCSAVAIGQICSYHKWPKQLDNRNYDWDKMLSKSRHNSIWDTGLFDVAHLILNIGELVKMKYGVLESISNIENAKNGFKNLGFKNVEVKEYSVSEITSSISINNPVYVRGTSSSDEGHAWVADGYDRYSTWTEYYSEETGEFMGSVGGSGYTYLHFNSGQKETEYNAFYLCAGKDGNNATKTFNTFGYDSKNKILTHSGI